MKKRRKTNKTIIFDENTKIISVNTDSQDTNKFKILLERNKIYFETILMLILTIAGIIVSIASVKVGIVANNIAENENWIADLEKQPVFILENEVSKTEEKYIVKNTGGDIQYGNLFLDKAFIISIHDENYDYLGYGCIILGGYVENKFSTYDFDTKSFTISTKLTSKPVSQWIEIIENIIIDEGYSCGIICTEYLDLMYQNYKQELLTRSMIVENGLIRDFGRDGEYCFKMYVNVNDLENEQLKKDIKREIELLHRYNK